MPWTNIDLVRDIFVFAMPLKPWLLCSGLSSCSCFGVSRRGLTSYPKDLQQEQNGCGGTASKFSLSL